MLLPWRFNIIIALGRLILTPSMIDNLNWATGGWKMMEKFQGRGQ